MIVSNYCCLQIIVPDRTYEECLSVQALPEYAGRDLTIINRSGTGGKAGVLNDALKMATGDYICVYDADAVPEKNALYFLVKEVLQRSGTSCGILWPK